MLYKSIYCNYIFQSVCAVALFIVLSISPIYAASTYAQSTNLKLELSKASINEVFRSIEEKSEFVFFYADEVRPELKQHITLKVKSGTIDQIMSSALENTNLTYKLNDRQVIITRKAEVPQDNVKKGIAINGTVMDQANEPLIGVNVTVKGTEIGAITDINGNYFITTPSQNSVLVFQYIGFEPQEVRVGRQININVNMKEVPTDLNEVVVIAYGQQKKASVIGSIATLEPTRLQQSPTRALSNNLAGQLAGVIAVQRSGEPGKDGSNFWIRGISSFQNAGRSPLILVDGIERTLDDMDPAEIESFSVLKDASASAVYGVRGANGVVLVNTKRGTMGKPSINVHFEQSFTQPVKLPSYIGSADYLSLLNELYLDKGYTTPLSSEEVIQNYRNNTDPDLYSNVNWMDAITKDHASNSRVNLTVNGGSELLRYSLVASYYGESGIFTRDKKQTWDSSTKLNKYNIRSNVDVNLTKTTIVRINIGGYLQETNEMVDPDSGNSESAADEILKYAFETPPFVHPARYSSGEIPRVQNRSNPWALATQHGFTTYSSSKIESLFSLEQDLKFILPGLKVKGIFSFDRWSKSGVKRHKGPIYYNPASARNDEGDLIMSVGTNGQEFLDTEQLKEWGNKATYIEANLTYAQSFGKHHVEGLFLYNQRDYQDGSVVPYRRMGIAGRASYTFDGRYIAEFNFGYNGSENFAKGFRFGFFPSVAVGYLMSEEAFMSPYRETFSKIKFKGSWGLVGNDQFAGRRFSYITTIDQSGDAGYNWGVNNDYHRDGRFEGDFGVPDLTWETVEKFNVGLELGLWNALELQVDLFKERRKDIFMERKTTPTAAGFIKTPWANYGIVDNKGVEVLLGYNQQINKDWFVGFRGTFTYAANKIIEQDEAPGTLGTNRSSTGLPVNQLFGLVADRLFTEDDFEDIPNGKLKEGIPSQTLGGTLRPGDIKYIDVDGDGVVGMMDKTAIGGTYDPQIVYGFGANASYKNFDVNLFFQGNGRTWRFIGGNNFLPGSSEGAMGNILSNYNDRWTADNASQDVFYPRLSYGINENNRQESTWWLRNMSMLRMRDIEVGYRLPKQVINKLGLSSLRIYLKGANLLTFSGFKLWDPEVDTSNGAKYPVMKSLSFGLDINF